MLSYAFVDGFTRVRRDEAIQRLKGAIAEADGVIVDFAFFSNEAIRLSVEIEAVALAKLEEALTEGGVHVFERCAAELKKSRDASSRPIIAMLHIAFVRDEADLAAHLPG
ncbi:MAG: hypothetical protein KF819_33925 [Labilithrix sp.]|nr:hypothetical protein [Labilithrix sp.]